ncbi:MAG: hypothetical protein ACRDGT_10085 [Candidatus Limnocylindria bacterium]
MKTPTWAQIEQLLAIDGGWQATRQTKHVFYEKVLSDGRTFNTHVFHARDKTMHPDTFGLISRAQLGVTVEEFWRTLESGKSERSQTPPPPALKRPTLAMFMELRRKLHLTDAELEGVTFEDAKQRLDEFHSRYRP